MGYREEMELRKQEMALKKKWTTIQKERKKQFRATDKFRYSFAVDNKNRLIRLTEKSKYKMTTNIFTFDEILSFETGDNAGYTAKRGVPRVLLFGFFAKKVQRVDDWHITVRTSSIYQEFFTITLIQGSVRTNSAVYKQAMRAKEQIIMKLSTITEERKKNIPKPKNFSTTAEEIKILKELLDFEAITPEEFDRKKKELLNW